MWSACVLAVAMAASAGEPTTHRTNQPGNPARARLKARALRSSLVPVTEWGSDKIVDWLQSATKLKVNGTAAAELGLHGYMLFDMGLNNDTLTRIGIADEAAYLEYLRAVNSLDARITKSPRSFFEWRAANRRICDYWLAPLATFSPRVLLLWLRFSETERGSAFHDLEDDVADNKTISDFVVTVLFVPHYPLFLVTRQFHTQGWTDTVLQLMALIYFLDDVGICLACIVGSRGQRQHALRTLREEIFGISVALAGYHLAWAISPTWAFDVILHLYLYVIFPGLCIRRVYFQLREVVIDPAGSGSRRLTVSNSDVNPVVHVFEVPSRVAANIERTISADWVMSFAYAFAVILLLLALHLGTDRDRDGDVDFADFVASLDFDSDGDLDLMDMLDMIDQDGDQELAAAEAGFAIFQGLTCWTCVAAAAYFVIFVIGIQLGQEHVQNKTLQMDIREKDIAYDDEQVVLGRGTFGEVYRTRSQPFGGWRGATVAVKRLIGTDSKNLEAVRAELRAEALMLALMRHPNIVAFYGVCLDSSEPLLLTELLEGGSLHDRLYKDKMERLTHAQKRGVARDVGAGLMYLHGKDVAHLDLKPHNVLLTKPPLVAKLCDFGLTRVTRNSLFNIPKMRPGGTPLYMSPEQHEGWFNITTRSDVYSFGVLLNELETHSLPWIDEISLPPGETDSGGWILKEIKRRTLADDRPTLCDSGLIGTIVEACWLGRAEDRPLMTEVMYGRAESMADGVKRAGWSGLTYVMNMELDDDRHGGDVVALKKRASVQYNYDVMFDLDHDDDIPIVRQSARRSYSAHGRFSGSGVAASVQ